MSAVSHAPKHPGSLANAFLCPNCLKATLKRFYQIDDVPVHSVVLLRSRVEALNFPTGEIDLGFCSRCAFISNINYNPELQDYSQDYESTQSFSPTFTHFATDLAERLIDRHDLHGKTLLEIGCGQGEFLTQLCALGRNTGIGFDPAYLGDQEVKGADYSLRFYPEFFTEDHTQFNPDFIVCKMTMEHIPDPARFLGVIRSTLDTAGSTRLFFQVPEAVRILRQGAFWDVYYEHCSYFSPESLRTLFEEHGFDVLRLTREYDDQYLLIEASFGGRPTQIGPILREDLRSMESAVQIFSQNTPHRIVGWKKLIRTKYRQAQKLVVWGGGSKAVTFLNTLHLGPEIEAIVDVNPRKAGTYLPSSGHKVLLPHSLSEIRPDAVFVMNPVYESEIRNELDQLGLHPELILVQ